MKSEKKSFFEPLIDKFDSDRVAYAFACYKASAFILHKDDTTISKRIIYEIRKLLSKLHDWASVYQYFSSSTMKQTIEYYKMAEDICDRYEWPDCGSIDTQVSNCIQQSVPNLEFFSQFENAMIGGSELGKNLQAKSTYYLAYLAYCGVLQPDIEWELRKGGMLMINEKLHKQVKLFYSFDEIEPIIQEFENKKNQFSINL